MHAELRWRERRKEGWVGDEGGKRGSKCPSPSIGGDGLDFASRGGWSRKEANGAEPTPDLEEKLC